MNFITSSNIAKVHHSQLNFYSIRSPLTLDTNYAYALGYIVLLVNLVPVMYFPTGIQGACSSLTS